MPENKVAQYGEKAVYVASNTGEITIHTPSGVRIINPNNSEDIELLKEWFGSKFEELISILNQHNLGLGNHFPKILGTPPFRPEVFIGRATDLKTIHQKLFNNDNVLLLVNGEGGIGKTAIASRYFFIHEDDYTHLAWIFAEKSLLDALMTLSIPLKMDYPPKMPNEERLSLLLAKMRTLAKPCLLVIDNANNLEDLEKYYVALKSCPNFHLLLTTRITEFEQAERHRISPLSDADAKELFVKYYPKYKESEEDLLKQVFIAVGKNTLVIELLAKNLFLFNRLKDTYTLYDLIVDLKNKGLFGVKNKTVVRTAYKASGHALRKEKPEVIIAAMYDLGELSKEEKRLMSVFAVLPAENISFSILEELLAETIKLEDTIMILYQKGWLDFNDKNNSFKISPVVQDVIKRKSNSLIEDCEELMDNLIKKLRYDPGSTAHLLNSSYQEAHTYSNYVECILSNIQLCSNDIILLYERIGGYNKAIGNLKKALAYYSTFSRLSKVFKKEYPENLTFETWVVLSYEKLGSTYLVLGDLNRALVSFKEFSKLLEELCDKNPNDNKLKSDLSIAYSRLGVIYNKLGNIEKALALFEDSRDLSISSYNMSNKDRYQKLNLGYSYQFIGNMHIQLGDYELAKNNFEEMATIFNQLCEGNNIDASFENGYGVAHMKIGDLNRKLKKYKDALISYRKSSEIFKRLYSKYSQNVNFKQGFSVTLAKIGEVYIQLENFDKAKFFLTNRHSISKELFKDFPRNVSFKNNLIVSYSQLGDLYLKMDNFDEALKYLMKCSSLAKDLYEQQDENIEFKNGFAMSLGKLGNFYKIKNEKNKAKKSFQKSRKLFEELVKYSPKQLEFQSRLEEVINDLESL